MTNLDSVLKSRDITLLTKIYIVKVMVCPVVMHGCRESNGTPFQYSCLENPKDGGAWWAAVHGFAKSRTQLSDFTFIHRRRRWQPTPVFLPGESQGRGSMVGCCLGVAHSWTRLKQLSSSSSSSSSNSMYGCESWMIKLSAEKLMLSNCGVGEDSSESLGQQGDQTNQSQRKSTLNIH